MSMATFLKNRFYLAISRSNEDIQVSGKQLSDLFVDIPFICYAIGYENSLTVKLSIEIYAITKRNRSNGTAK